MSRVSGLSALSLAGLREREADVEVAATQGSAGLGLGSWSDRAGLEKRVLARRDCKGDKLDGLRVGFLSGEDSASMSMTVEPWDMELDVKADGETEVWLRGVSLSQRGLGECRCRILPDLSPRTSCDV